MLLLKSWMWMCCFSGGRADRNKSVISQQNGGPFQPISCIISVCCGSSTVSNAMLDMFHLQKQTSKQTKRLWCRQKKWKLSPTHCCGFNQARWWAQVAVCVSACWGNRKKKASQNCQTGPWCHLWGRWDYSMSSWPACHICNHGNTIKWLLKYAGSPPSGLTGQVTARQESLLPSHSRWERVRRKESNLTATFLENTTNFRHNSVERREGSNSTQPTA